MEIELEKYFKGDDLLMAEAIRKEDVKAIGDLSEKVDINGKFKEGLTFLLFAMSEGKFKSGQALLDHGADPLLINSSECAAEYAAGGEKTDWLKLFPFPACANRATGATNNRNAMTFFIVENSILMNNFYENKSHTLFPEKLCQMTH